MNILYNGNKIEVKEKLSIADIFKDEIKNSKYPVVGAIFNNEYKRLDFILTEDGEVSLIDISTEDGMKIYRRTLIFIMAKAFEKLYPEVKVRVNYQLSSAMFCTLDDMEVEEKMLKNVQEEMQEIINKNLPIIHKELTRNEAEKLYEEHNTSKGRLQLDLQQNDIINMYYCEDYYN